MNSKQRRRLRKQKLPELINLLATKRITGELHSWIDTGALIAGAARNPQRIYKVMPLIERGDYYDRHDFEQPTYGTTQGPEVPRRIASGANLMRSPRDPGKSVIYGKSIKQMLVDEIARAPLKNKTYDDFLDAIKYGSTQTFRTPEEVTAPCQESPDGL